MAIETIQKVIKIGASSGVTIPARDLRAAGIRPGEDVKVTIKKVKKNNRANDQEVITVAKGILKRYKKDFDNLAKR